MVAICDSCTSCSGVKWTFMLVSVGGRNYGVVASPGCRG
jgi:hypothetical protein